MANATAIESPVAYARTSIDRASSPAAAPQQQQQLTQTHSLGQWLIGCVFLVIVAVIWNFSSVLVQYIFHDLSFEAPFFLTSFGMALFAVNLPIYYITKILIPRLRGVSTTDGSDLPLTKPNDDQDVVVVPLPIAHSPAMLRRTMIAAAIISPLWFIANFTYNESLNLTSVTSSTILSATSSVFTLLFGVWILKEKFTWGKLLGVVLCMAGNCSTLANDTSGGVSDYFWGDVCAFAGAVMYGVYTTAIRIKIPDNSGMSVSLFFGFVGLFSFCWLAVFVLVFNYTNVESLHGLNWEIIGLLFVQGLFNNVLADYLWAVAILYTSTTVATVGLSLTVPMAILSDWIIHGMSPSYVTLISSVLVLGGFVIITLSTRKEQLETLAAQARLQQEQERVPVTTPLVSPVATQFKEMQHKTV